MELTKATINKWDTKTFRGRFILYCWCTDWHSGSGSREYRLSCKLRRWLTSQFFDESAWVTWHDKHATSTNRTKAYKTLTTTYIDNQIKEK